MKRLTAILAILAVAALAAWRTEPPKPRPPKFGVSLRAAGTTVWVKWSISATPSDSLTVDVSGPTNLHRKYVVSSKTDSVAYGKPPAGSSIGGAVVGMNWRGSRSASAPPVTWNYQEPDTTVTPPSVTVQVTPTSVTVTPGSQTQFTATVS